MNCKNALAVSELTLESVVYSVDSRENQVQSSIALKRVTSHSLGILDFILEVFPAGKLCGNPWIDQETSYIQSVLRGHIHSL